MVLWFTGLSGSGKSTIALALEKELLKRGYYTKLLDGDNIRTGLSSNVDFTIEGRTESIRRVAEVAKLFVENGTVTLCSFISPTNDIRKTAREIIGDKDFVEIYVNTSLETCEARDVKGLYKKAKAGEIKNFTGINAPYEEPINPNVIIKGDGDLEVSVNQLMTIFN